MKTKIKPRMKGSMSEPMLFLFIIAAVAYFLGIYHPLSVYPMINVTSTSAGQSIGIFNTPFFVAFMLAFGTAGTAAVAVSYLTSGDKTLILVAAIATFMITMLADLPLEIFSDVSIPFPVKLVIGGSISIILIYAIIEFVTGRFKT